VLSLPFWNVSDRGLYAQSTADMRFKLEDAWLQLMPAQGRRVYGFANYLSAPKLAAMRGAARVDAFEDELCSAAVDYLVVWNHGPQLLAGLDLAPPARRQHARLPAAAVPSRRGRRSSRLSATGPIDSAGIPGS